MGVDNEGAAGEEAPSDHVTSQEVTPEEATSDNVSAEEVTGRPRPVDYPGAVYGSLLAASVVTGSAAEGEAAPAAELVALLIVTGLVFWIAHVYAQFVGQGLTAKSLTWTRTRAVARREWPMAQASFPPAMSAALMTAFGASDAVAAWAALGVAVTSQVTWAVAAARNAGATTGVVVVSGMANLILGLAIVALKTVVAH